MIAPTPYFADRGCHVRIYEEARALTKRGHEVCIVTYHLGRDMPGVRVVRIPHVPWYNKLEAGPSWHKPYLDILLLWKSLAEVRSFRPHLIHAHLHEGALIGSVLKASVSFPAAVRLSGQFERRVPQSWLFSRYIAADDDCSNGWSGLSTVGPTS